MSDEKLSALRGRSYLAPTALVVLMLFHTAPESRAQDVAKPQSESVASSNKRFSALTIGKLNAETQQGAWRVRWDNNLGVPRALSGARTVPYGADPETAAKAFLHEYAAIFIPRADAAKTADNNEFELRSIRSVKGGSRAEFQQTLSGVPVYRSSVILIMDPDGRVFHVSNSARPLQGANTTRPNSIEQIDATFRAQTNAVNAPASMESHDLVIYPGPSARLAYRVIYKIGVKAEPWEYVLDAVTGETLRATRLVFESNKRTSTVTLDLEPTDTPPSGSPPITVNKPMAVFKINVDLKTADPAPSNPALDVISPRSGEKLDISRDPEHKVASPPDLKKPGAAADKARPLSPPPSKVTVMKVAEEG